jgi:hypothetical protein
MNPNNVLATSDINDFTVNSVGGVLIEAMINIRLAMSYHKELMLYLNAIEIFKFNSFVYTPKYLNFIIFKYCTTVISLRKIGTPPTNEYLLKMSGFEHLELEYKDKK